MKLLNTGLSALIGSVVLVLSACGGGSGTAPSTPTPTPIPSQPAPAAWSVTGSQQTARYMHTATLLLSGKVLVIGGISLRGDGQTAPAAPNNLSSVEQYDPATKAWSAVAPLATSRYGHTATVLANGKVLVAGGQNPAGATASVELYDPATNTWTAGPSLATTRINHTATLLPNGKVLVAGGRDDFNHLSNGAEIYDAATNTWVVVGSMAAARYSHSATLLPNGKVLFVGGNGINSTLPGPEIYNPTTDTWTAAAMPTAAVGEGTATLLANGKVLFVRGYTSTQNAELYDPASNTWTLAGTLSTSHAIHTTTLLPNGTVLLVGGGTVSVHSATTYATDVTELYDPATNTWSVSAPLVVGPRLGHTATMLGTGAVLITGGTPASGWWYQPTRAETALYTLL